MPRESIGHRILTPRQWEQITTSLTLSRRESEVARGVFDGLAEPAIANQLGISVNTVHTHMTRLHRKLGAKTRVQVVLRVIEELLVVLEKNQRDLQHSRDVLGHFFGGDPQ